MQKHTRKTLLRALAAAIGLTASLSASAADPLKVGFVYIGPIGDHGWTYQHEQGRKYMEEKLGDKVQTSFVENVPEGADAERVIRNMAKGGYDWTSRRRRRPMTTGRKLETSRPCPSPTRWTSASPRGSHSSSAWSVAGRRCPASGTASCRRGPARSGSPPPTAASSRPSRPGCWTGAGHERSPAPNDSR